MDLKEIIELVANHWQWNGEAYPGWSRLPDEKSRKEFQRQHVLNHLMKQVGRLAARQERVDHGEADLLGERTALTEQTGKLAATALHYASLSGVSVEEIEAWIKAFYST